MLEVEGLVVRYGTTTAVAGVDLRVATGEIVAILGPSGCGKSSLLRAVAGLEPPAAGTVAWDGRSLAGVPVHRRGFGLMFQDGQLFPHRDVAGNVEFGLRMSGVDRSAREARVAELLDVVGLAGYGSRAVGTLSGGEQQRVALARALAPRPRLLLLDEPLSALDRSLRGRLAADLRDALLATGTTALLVTHDHDEAFAVADRVAVMDGGRVLQVADPASLWSAPASRRVADLLGYEAFVPAPDGTVTAYAAGAFVVVEDGPGGAAAAPPSGADLPDGVATGRVVGTAFRRGRVEVTVDVEGVGRVTARAPAGRTWAPGDVVALAVDPSGLASLPSTGELPVLPVLPA